MDLPVRTKTFDADILYEGSWGARAAGRHQSTMTLYETADRLAGFIEWDIPSLGEGESIGLSYEWRGASRALADYDGIMSLPKEAIALLREHGIIVDEDFC